MAELPVSLRADLDVDLNNESVHSDNLHLDVDGSRITGSADVRRFDDTGMVRFDLEADAIDADRLLPPVPANADDPVRDNTGERDHRCHSKPWI